MELMISYDQLPGLAKCMSDTVSFAVDERLVHV